MATTRRSSFGASSINSGRRMSSSSSTLPPLPPSTDSLTSSTVTPPPSLAHPPSAPLPPPTFAPPAPLPPPKEPASMPMPLTPQRKPVLRQKSPLSNEAYFASPASSMPGTFPTTPPAASSPTSGTTPAQFSTTAYASASSPSTTSKSPKRPISVRSLLSFKALRRSSDHTSPDSQKFRPMSPGGDSTFSSSQPSLNKKRSGSFWRRKSSLGMTFGKEGEDEDKLSSPVTGVETVMEENQARSPSPETGSDFPLVKKRKSGTFWRRKSSLSLASAVGGNSEVEAKQNGVTAGTMNGMHNTMNGGQNGTGGEQGGMNGSHKDPVVEKASSEKPLPPLTLSPIRSRSPPPQLPAFVGGGEGLGDLFKDIN